MRKTRTGAQRYNKGLDEIFEKAKIVQEQSAPQRCRCGTCDAIYTICKDQYGTYVSNHRCI